MNEIEAKLRDLALRILSDEHGISQDAFDSLYTLLLDTINQDVLDYIQTSGGRYHLTPEITQQLRMTK